VAELAGNFFCFFMHTALQRGVTKRHEIRKPFKRFPAFATTITALKRGVNETKRKLFSVKRTILLIAFPICVI